MQAAVKTLKLVTEPPSEVERLFRAHHDRVFRTAHRITGRAEDAEDVLQTVFLRLVKSEEGYDLSDNPEAYLSRAAINASLDLLRHRSRAKLVDIDNGEAETLPSRFNSPEAEHGDRELHKLIRQSGTLARPPGDVRTSFTKDTQPEIARCSTSQWLWSGLYRALTN